MARDIETTVVVDGDEICEIVEDYLTDSDYITSANLEDHISDNGVLTENDDVWSLVEHDVDGHVMSSLDEYFSSYGSGSDRIQEQVENTLPEWLRSQLTDIPVNSDSRCALGKAFTDAVNTVITTTDTNVEWATKVEALEARVYALEEVIYAMHNTWKDLNPHNDEPHPARNGRSEREKYAANMIGLS